jgi:hypothetical protein
MLNCRMIDFQSAYELEWGARPSRSLRSASRRMLLLSVPPCLCLPRSTGWQKSVFIRLPCRSPGEGRCPSVVKNSKQLGNSRSRFLKAIKGYSRLPNPIQGFLEKKLFFVTRPLALLPSISPRPMTTNQTNPKPKSTAGCRKSTVDLGCELLIWSKNGLPIPLSPPCRHPFRPITAQEMKRANRKQTQAGQKINASTLDLGCEENASPMEKTATAPF